ncbi:MAG: hypothetical protein ACAI18_02545 [Gemmatimonadales bacterium]
MNASRYFLAALCLSSTLSAVAADAYFGKWIEQFSRWKSRPQQGAYDKMVSGGHDGSTLVSFPHSSGMLRSVDGGRTFEAMTLPGTDFYDVAVAPLAAGVFYAQGIFSPRTLHRTLDAGRTWTTHGAALAADRQGIGLAVSADANVVYRTVLELQLNCENICSAKSGTLQRSTDAGASWVAIGGPQDHLRAFPSPIDAQVVYAISRGGLLRSTDQGTSWQTMPLPAGSTPTSISIGTIAQDRIDSGIAYMVQSLHDIASTVYATRDAGLTWSATPLPGGRLFADPITKGRAYLFTHFFGTYETRDAGLSWVKVEPSVFTSVNSNVSGVVLQSGRRVAIGPYFNTIRELQFPDGALALGSDLWWNPAESGWGLTITHRASIQTFIAWYTYDDAGAPVWRVIPGGKWTDRTFTGDVYETSAGKYFGNPFDASRVARRRVGIAVLSFDNEDRAVFSWQLDGGNSGSKRIERQLFGPPAGQNVARDSYADLWWNASESGWGIAINHQNNNIFATWFAYDDSGQPLWLVMPDAKIALVNDVPTASGDVHTVRGPIASVRFDSSRVVTTKVGTASLAFTSPAEATLASTIFGRSETRAISRQPF